MIRRIRVQNFKSLEDTSVDLGDVTVLVGRSGTGKTNFVMAIGFLRDYLYFGKPQNPKQLSDWNRLLPATKPNAETSFEVEFDVKGIEEAFTYCVALHQRGHLKQVARESLRLGHEVLFAQAERKWEVEPKLIPLPQPGQPAIGQIPSISEVVIAYTALTTAIGCYDFPATVLGEVDQQAGTSISGLNDDAGNYLQTLRNIVSNLQDLNVRRSMTATLQRLNSSISAVELHSIQQPKNVVVGHKLGDKTLTLTLAQESGGFRRLFAHLLALYQLPPKQTLVFEEPENGIYPGALELLADEFKAAPSAGRGQVILTTHSPGLLDHFSADQIRVVVLDGFQTHIGRISREQKDAIKEQLLEPGELLTVDEARIEDAETADA